MISYRELAMRVVGKPLRTKNTPPPMAHRATALALTAAMMAALAAPAFAGVYYIGDGDITVTKTDSGTYVKHSGKNYGSDSLGDEDNDEIIIKGGSSKATQELVDESRPVVAMDEDTGDSENDLTYSDPTPVVTWPDVASDEDDTSEEPVDETADPVVEEEETSDQQSVTSGQKDDESTDHSELTTDHSAPTTDSSTLESPAPAVPVNTGKSDEDDDSNAVTYESKTPAQVFTDAASKAVDKIIKIINNATSGTLNVTLENVNIDASQRDSDKQDNALTVEGNGDTTLTLKGDNTLQGGAGRDGLHCYDNGKLTITGGESDKLTATGGNSSNYMVGFGIRSNDGDVSITGGIINATGGEGSFSTGSYGIFSNSGEVSISDGTINAKGGDNGCGIWGNTVTISGGTIQEASGDVYGISGGCVTIKGTAQIEKATGDGAGIYGGTSVSIEGGSVTVQGSDYGIISSGITGGGTVTIKDGTVNASGEYAGIYGGTSVSIEGGNVEATGGKAIYSGGTVSISGDDTSVTATATGDNGSGIRSGTVSITGGKTTITGGSNGRGIDISDELEITGDTEVSIEAGKPIIKDGQAIDPSTVLKDDKVSLTVNGQTVLPMKPDLAPVPEQNAPVISSDDSDSTPAPEAVVITPAGVQGFWFTGMLGNSISVKADVNGSTMEFSSLRYAAALHTTLGQLRQLKEQGITHVTFKTMLCTTTFAIDDLLPLGDDATEVVLSHNGKAATLTVGGVVR